MRTSRTAAVGRERERERERERNETKKKEELRGRKNVCGSISRKDVF